MAEAFRNINVKVQRREVAVLQPDGSERLGFFHKWTELVLPTIGVQDRALIEAPDGTMTYISANKIRFLPIENEVSAEELEETYIYIGILKG